MSHEPSTLTAEAEVELALFSTGTGHELCMWSSYSIRISLIHPLELALFIN